MVGFHGTVINVDGGGATADGNALGIYSAGTLRLGGTLGGGDLLLATAADGLHAETAILIAGGSIDLTTSYEGIATASITVEGGEVRVPSTDDGVDTVADGTAANMNGALDCAEFTISGGLPVAVGSAGMAMAPDESSPQALAGLAFRSATAGGTMVHIQSVAGEDIPTFVPTKDYAAVVVSSPDLEYGTTYVVCAGGSSPGAETDALCAAGSHAPRPEAGTFAL